MINEKKLRSLIKNASKDTINLSYEELKEKYISSFGIDKWCEEEMLGRLIDLSIEVSNYLGIEMLPIVFEEMIDDARIYFDDGYIAINQKHKDNFIECAKSITHELRHLYQAIYSITSSDNRFKRMRRELQNPVELDPNDIYSITKYTLQEIEIDAYAFSKWYLKTKLGIDVIHPSPSYETIINDYIDKYF